MDSRLAQHLLKSLVTKVDIFVSCHNLLDMDLLSKSDPCCALYILKNNQWIEIGRTEKIMNDLNPQFSKCFSIDYFFERVQKIKFRVFDIDNDTYDLSDDDFLGQFECTLGELVSNSPIVSPLYLTDKKPAGKSSIVLRAIEEKSELQDLLTLKFSATNLDKKDFFGKSDPYLEISKKMTDGGYQVVHRTEYVKKTLDPEWREFEIEASKLSGSDYNDPIKVDCYDYNNNTSPDFIGSFETSVAQLLSAANKTISWPCINIKKKSKKSYQNSGMITLSSCKVNKKYSFLDYVFGGLELKFCVSIDFTASNGDPSNPQSLHFFSPNNSYCRAIRSVGEVIKDYDHNQLFLCSGFGARLPPRYEVSHYFPLSDQSNCSFAFGIQGIIDAYYSTLRDVQLYGPTNFSPTINHLINLSQQTTSLFSYYVLLIITDGIISDMRNTIETIIRGSSCPLSIIIVGVGNEDFEAMNALDSDEKLLSDGLGHIAKRDIVQFVPFRKFEGASIEVLAQEVLEELPDQVIKYYKMIGRPPGPLKLKKNEQPFSKPFGNYQTDLPPPYCSYPTNPSYSES